jgi:hypothetical protein
MEFRMMAAKTTNYLNKVKKNYKVKTRRAFLRNILLSNCNGLYKEQN